MSATPPATADDRGSDSILQARSGRARLWLCLWLPRLPLEVHAGLPEAPRAIFGGDSSQSVILICNEAAGSDGVRAGMPVNAALALSPHLDLRPRDPGNELDALRKLAVWAIRYTPVVSIDPAGACFLEVAGSSRLFGGLDRLRGEVVSGVARRGHAVMAAVAPTARAALWLARSGQDEPVTDIAQLPAILARLALSQTDWPPSVREAMFRMGVRDLGQCMRLPRDGLRRRVGELCLAEIDEALGRRSEVHRLFSCEARFCDELDLPAETRETGLLREALRILLDRFRDYLRSRQAGAWVLWLRLRHRRKPDTLLRIGLLRPSADVGHLEDLAAMHMSALTVPAPVFAIALEADVTEAPPPSGGDLPGMRQDERESVTGLVERLRTRLGLRAVHGIRSWGEHRPEHAWRVVADPLVLSQAAGGVDVPGVLRPLWILDQPAELSERSGAPFFRGPLVLDSGPERIETGWWDGGDVRRDYYVAWNHHGVRVWIFRDHRARKWYLHGLFG